jgi:hypothetical protein
LHERSFFSVLVSVAFVVRGSCVAEDLRILRIWGNGKAKAFLVLSDASRERGAKRSATVGLGCRWGALDDLLIGPPIHGNNQIIKEP